MQVTLIKQEKVACLTDSDAHLALEPKVGSSRDKSRHGLLGVRAGIPDVELASRATTVTHVMTQSCDDQVIVRPSHVKTQSF